MKELEVMIEPNKHEYSSGYKLAQLDPNFIGSTQSNHINFWLSCYWLLKVDSLVLLFLCSILKFGFTFCSFKFENKSFWNNLKCFYSLGNTSQSLFKVKQDFFGNSGCYSK